MKQTLRIPEPEQQFKREREDLRLSVEQLKMELRKSHTPLE